MALNMPWSGNIWKLINIPSYTIQQLVENVELFFGNGLLNYFESSEGTMEPIVERFQRSSSVENHKADKHNHNGCSDENVDFVRANVGEEPLVDIQNKFGLVKSQHSKFYESI